MLNWTDLLKGIRCFETIGMMLIGPVRGFPGKGVSLRGFPGKGTSNKDVQRFFGHFLPTFLPFPTL